MKSMLFLHDDSKVCCYNPSKCSSQSMDFYRFLLNFLCFLDFELAGNASLNKLFALQLGITVSKAKNYGNIPLY